MIQERLFAVARDANAVGDAAVPKGPERQRHVFRIAALSRTLIWRLRHFRAVILTLQHKMPRTGQMWMV